MTAKRAEDIQLSIDVTALGDFIPIGVLRGASITMNAIAIDISNIESAEIHQALSQTPAAKIAGQCIFNGDPSFERARAYFTTSIIMEWLVIIPYFGAIQGLFEIRSLNQAGRSAHGPVAELALQLAGKPRFMIAEAVTVKA
jgi:predicted secreted protein